jgi:hypothetical protein
VKTIDDFVLLLRDEMGLDITVPDAARGFDELPGWDSVHLLSLLTLMEQTTGRQVALPAVLEAPSLEDVYRLYVG